MVGDAIMEVTKNTGDGQSSVKQVLKVQAEIWLARKDLIALQDAIAV